MGINVGSIMSKLEIYAGSSSGKNKMDKCISDYIKAGKNKTASGEVITSTAQMEEAADILVRLIFKYAAPMPASVFDLLSTLENTPPSPFDSDESSWYVNIQFENKSLLRRESLRRGFGSEARTGDGIDNIISLFDTGYYAHRKVYGVWDTAQAKIASKMRRHGIQFMKRAVDEFNTIYGNKYHCVASIVADPMYYTR